MLSALFQQRRLIASLTRREIEMRFRGSILGAGWYILNSLVILAMYTLVFGSIFKVPWPNTVARPGVDSTGVFAITIFSGLIIYNLVTECLIKAPTLIVSSPNYVKKVVFPVEILPVVSVGAALFNAAIAWAVLIAIACWYGMWPTVNTLFVPLVLLPLIPVILGFAWLFASLGVYVRDVAQVVPLLTTVMLFMGPVFYPLASIPEPFRTVAAYNPLTLPIEQVRLMMFDGAFPDLYALAVATVVGLVIAWLGYKWFTVTKRGFADVI
jgi:lipopolysaccharide transport system permease protein